MRYLIIALLALPAAAMAQESAGPTTLYLDSLNREDCSLAVEGNKLSGGGPEFRGHKNGDWGSSRCVVSIPMKEFKTHWKSCALSGVVSSAGGPLECQVHFVQGNAEFIQGAHSSCSFTCQ